MLLFFYSENTPKRAADILADNPEEKIPTKARRDKGEGSVFQRKNGTWASKWQPTKTAKVKYFYGKTELEVKKKYASIKRKRQKMTSRKSKKLPSGIIWIFGFAPSRLTP
jgi:hypothetical protein